MIENLSGKNLIFNRCEEESNLKTIIMDNLLGLWALLFLFF
jgi:hypothetical protein